jgi:transcriptional regulator of arginine metabolism
MKNLRLEKIKQIVTQNEINTQDELLEALHHEGFDVTQATISRDINHLMIMKIPIGTGRYRYTTKPDPAHSLYIKGRLRIFQDSTLSIDSSENIIVLHTLPGSAEAVAYLIDYVEWPEVIGTLAGDNTIFILLKTSIAAKPTLKKLQSLLKSPLDKALQSIQSFVTTQ